MSKITITQNKLLKEYTKEINEIAELCDWKDTFSGEEVCGIVHSILTKNKVSTKLTPKKLHTIYSKKVKSLKLTRSEWVENYGVKEIIGLIYTILEENK